MRPKTAVAIAFIVTGLGCVVAAGYEGLHYSAWADPGALGGMVRWGAAGLICLAVPAAMIVVWFARELAREARRLGLSPAEAALVQAVVLETAHHEWSKYNQEWSERLAGSVMGEPREWTQ